MPFMKTFKIKEISEINKPLSNGVSNWPSPD